MCESSCANMKRDLVVGFGLIKHPDRDRPSSSLGRASA